MTTKVTIEVPKQDMYQAVVKTAYADGRTNEVFVTPGDTLTLHIHSDNSIWAIREVPLTT